MTKGLNNLQRQWLARDWRNITHGLFFETSIERETRRWLGVSARIMRRAVRGLPLQLKHYNRLIKRCTLCGLSGRGSVCEGAFETYTLGQDSMVCCRKHYQWATQQPQTITQLRYSSICPA